MTINDIVKFLQKENLIDKFNIFENTSIKGISDDSRDVKKGFVFIAVRGIHTDGNKFIDKAVKKGAVLIISELPRTNRKIREISYIEVKNARQTFSLLCAYWYGMPSKKLKVIGVTGTKGKTTVVHLLYHLMKEAGYKVGMISTIEAKIGNESVDTGLHVTNPEPLFLHALLKKMVDKEMEYAIIEVTSHGLDQERVYGINFDIGVLTNITPEHLDYHKTFSRYRQTKLKLLERSNMLVVNRDDKSTLFVKSIIAKKDKVIQYSQVSRSDIMGRVNKIDKGIMFYDVLSESRSYKGRIQLPGNYNLYNILASISAGKLLGISIIDSISALNDFSSPEGRLEKVENKKGINIYIDFAHTPDSLENLLKLLNSLKNDGRLICVYGCAGERDRKKRFEMGKISGNLAGISVITAEDPRSENVLDIISQIRRGMVKTGAKEYPITLISKQETINNHTSEQVVGDWNKNYYILIPDRSEAIYYSINNIAHKGDTVVICGKGHEKSMCYGNIEHNWSDYRSINDALALEETNRTAIIMCAGKGKRLNSDLPKVINKLAGKPMVLYAISNLRKSGYKHIKLIVGYKAPKVINEVGNTVSYTRQKYPLGTGHAAWQGIKTLKNLDEPVLVMNGDDSAFYKPETLKEIYDSHVEQSAAVTFASAFLDDPTGIGRLLRDKKGQLIKIVEERNATDSEKKIKETNIGLYVFNPNWFLRNIKKVRKSDSGEYYIVDLIEIAIKNKEKVNVYRLKNIKEWCGVNTMEQLNVANERMIELVNK